MLAMLACILDEPQASNKSTGKSISGSSLDHTPPSHHHFASRYYPSEEIARSHLNFLSPSELSIQVDSQRMISGPHSASSSFGPTSDLSTSETPPLQYKSTRTSPEHRNLQSPSLSTLTEYQRHTHRSNSNLSAFASLPRPFPFGSAAASPPNSYPKKRSSPVGSYLGNPASMNVWNSGFFGKSSAITEAPKSSLSLSVSDAEEDVVTIAKKPVFMTKLKNQDQFHNDGYANVPLLDPSKEWRYHAYREAYAHLLYVWDMPIARAEVLNHNRPLHPDTLPTFTFGPKTTAPFGAIAGANLLSSGYNTENLNPVFRDHCHFCSTLLLPSEKPSRRCQSCSKLQPAPLCLLCNTAIRGLASPCSNCGHVVHASCRQVLSQASLDECPSGCGCICADYTFMRLTTSVAGSVSTRDESQPEDVSPADSPQPLETSGEGVNEQEQLGWKEQGWENAAYESLARNLRPRTESRGKMSI